MDGLKQRHIIAKNIKQILLVLLELCVVVGLLTYISCKQFPTEDWVELLERIGIFYAIYQIAVYSILSTLNDIKTDQYLALKTATTYAILACTCDGKEQYNCIINCIDKELAHNMHNDLRVRNFYKNLKNYIESKDINAIEAMRVWAEHCMEESKLQWRFWFLLRIFK
ncbi:MAG: hypothetical protein ACI4DP_02140 [Candidatus Ornithomonoglobus sp.]